MSTTLSPIITEAGLQAVFNASDTGLEVTISEIALGDEGYVVEVNSDGRAIQDALVNEQERVNVAGGKRVDPYQINVSFVADSAMQYWVRELGFYLDDGTLFAIWSDAETPLAWKGAGSELLAGLEIVLTTLPADVVNVQSSDVSLELTLSTEMTQIGSAILDLQRMQTDLVDRVIALEERVPAPVEGE